jgi:ABC-type nitrate/sulfonate/bicarbonate transport system ATPase subunit
VSFDVAGGEFFTMLGPSGCGKTTTLRMIAGLEKATSGDIEVDGRDLRSVPPERRNIGMVFQSYALFPHLTVFENVAYGLRLRGQSGHEIDRRVAATLALLQLEAFSGRHPADLSGGQQQRVSIARALVYEPTMLLLDEPLANLDAKLRVMMREEIRALQRRLGITTLYVTHDQEEATAVSDRLAVFDGGRLIQAGTPEEIYSRRGRCSSRTSSAARTFSPRASRCRSRQRQVSCWRMARCFGRSARCLSRPPKRRRSRLTGWHRHDPSGARCAQCDRRRHRLSCAARSTAGRLDPVCRPNPPRRPKTSWSKSHGQFRTSARVAARSCAFLARTRCCITAEQPMGATVVSGSEIPARTGFNRDWMAWALGMVVVLIAACSSSIRWSTRPSSPS